MWYYKKMKKKHLLLKLHTYMHALQGLCFGHGNNIQALELEWTGFVLILNECLCKFGRSYFS